MSARLGGMQSVLVAAAWFTACGVEPAKTDGTDASLPAASGSAGAQVSGAAGSALAGSSSIGMPASGSSGSAGSAGAEPSAGAGHSAGGAAPGGAAAGAAGGGGTAGDAAAEDCTTQGTELCDDFESGAIDPARWAVNLPTPSAKIAVDQAQAHRGKYAAHFQVVAGQQSVAQLVDTVTFPAKDNAFYARIFAYFSPDLPADTSGGFHMGIILAYGNNDLGLVEAGLGSAGDKNYLGFSEYHGNGPNDHGHGPTFFEFGPRSKQQLEPKQWLCLELFQSGDASVTTRRVWVNDAELPEQQSSYAARVPPKFERLAIGIWQYHQTPVLSDLWIDDVRVSSQRVGCSR